MMCIAMTRRLVGLLGPYLVWVTTGSNFCGARWCDTLTRWIDKGAIC